MDTHNDIVSEYAQEAMLTAEELKQTLLDSAIKELDHVLDKQTINRIVREELTNIKLALHIANGSTELSALLDGTKRGD